MKSRKPAFPALTIFEIKASSIEKVEHFGLKLELISIRGIGRVFESRRSYPER